MLDAKTNLKGAIVVTPAQYKSASDRWDTENIAYEIDTQCGEMQWGGTQSPQHTGQSYLPDRTAMADTWAKATDAKK
jgi:hypothetical protein